MSKDGRPPPGCASTALQPQMPTALAAPRPQSRGPRGSSHHTSTRTSLPTQDTQTPGPSTENKVALKDGHQQEGAGPRKCSRASTIPGAAPAHSSPQTTSWSSTTCGDTEDHRHCRDCGKREKRTCTLLLRVASTQEQDAEQPPHSHLTGPWRRRRLEKGGCPIRCLSGQ